jgi:hypothetical protein
MVELYELQLLCTSRDLGQEKVDRPVQVSVRWASIARLFSNARSRDSAAHHPCSISSLSHLHQFLLLDLCSSLSVRRPCQYVSDQTKCWIFLLLMNIQVCSTPERFAPSQSAICLSHRSRSYIYLDQRSHITDSPNRICPPVSTEMGNNRHRGQAPCVCR